MDTIDSATPRRSTSPFDVGDQAQLFVDQVLVRSAESISFTLHPARKHPLNPLLKAEFPWEGWRLEIYGSVIYDEESRLFKMWYLGETPDIPDYPLLYATSRDGVHWEKPFVGAVSYAKADKHNIVATGLLLASVIRDSRDPDPQRRYKMICTSMRDREKYPWGDYETFVSADGLHWEPCSRGPIAPWADVITGYYDRRLGLYVGFPKNHTADIPGLPHPRRAFYVTTSRDFKTWTAPELAIYSDLRDDAGSLARIEEVRPILDVPDNPALVRTEFYGVGVYQAESCTVGFPWVFTVNNEARFGNQEGPGELQLAVSRDLRHWDRPFRTPCVTRGKLGEWDCGFFVTSAEALRVGDEVWLYYGGSNYTHGTPCLYQAEGTGRGAPFTGSIGLAIWTVDRFVSADGPAEGGTLTTVPIVYDGTSLEINASARPGGAVSVELLEADGRLIESSLPMEGDNLRHCVRWQTPTDLARYAGAAVVLRFSIRNAQLFSFAFRHTRADHPQ